MSPRTHSQSVITEIATRRRGREVSIYVDGEYAFTCDQEFVCRENLAEGKVVDAEQLAALARSADISRAREVALRLLEYRSRSRGEMTKRLEEKGYGPDTVAAVISSLEQTGLLDDQRHAEAFVLERVRRRPTGRRRLDLELREQWIPRAIINDVLTCLVPDDVELEMAVQALAEKMRGADLEDVFSLRRLYAYLQRRGFSSETIQEAFARHQRRLP